MTMDHVADLPTYVGRFAPSPTGDLHFGSLIAAVASYLQAKSQGGQWLVRIEDIDPPREVAGSAQKILQDLERLGMKSDQPVLYQSKNLDAFNSVRRSLVQAGLAYQCSCSRKSIPADGIYPGTCRLALKHASTGLSTRLMISGEPGEFEDGLQGRIREDLSRSSGDFIIWRADELPAYQLAVVIDDAFQGITEVVRGADLLDSTARQIYLQQTLKLPTPAYIHLPVATANGHKLGKRFGSDPLSGQNPARAIQLALDFLGHRSAESLELDGLWSWAVEHWDIARVPALKTINVDDVNVV